MAQAVLQGNTYERVTNVIRSGNSDALQEVARELVKSGAKDDPKLTQSVAELLVEQATDYSTRVMSSEGAKKEKLQRDADTAYRLALELMPEFNSNNPQTLNSLGYHLASNGSSKQDFQTAERLTRRAVEIYDKWITDREDAGSPIADLVAQRANTRDSLAWALFKLERYPEALQEQLDAIHEIRAAQRPGMVSEVAELQFHLAEIYAKLGQRPEAIASYKNCLKLPEGEDGIHDKARAALKSLGLRKDAGGADENDSYDNGIAPDRNEGQDRPLPENLPETPPLRVI
jgi:tetratricopeptide (TPR) repeat protein